MEVRFHAPADRGVTTLMYVGDDDAVDKAVTAPSAVELGAGILAAFVALHTHGVARLAAAGAAGYIGYRAYKARR